MAKNVKVTQKSKLNALRLEVFNVRGVRMRHNAIHHKNAKIDFTQCGNFTIFCHSDFM